MKTELGEFEVQEAMRRANVAKPSWRRVLRQRLDITPEKTDPLSRLVWAAIYDAEDEDDFVNLIQNHIEELRRALNVLKAGTK